MSNEFTISYYKPDHQPHGLIRIGTHVPPSLSVAAAEVLVSELQAAIAQHANGDPKEKFSKQ